MPVRVPQNPAKVPLRINGKLSVKDKIISSQKEKLAGICLSEMHQVFLCFKSHNFNQEACASELKLFQTCYNRHSDGINNKVEKTISGKATCADVNKLLQRFPERKHKL